MIQIVTFRLKNSIDRLTGAARLKFYNDEILEPLQESLPKIAFLVRTYDILKALLKKEEYLACNRKKDPAALIQRVYSKRNEFYSLKGTRICVDEAFDTFITAVNTAYRINSCKNDDPETGRRLAHIIHTINTAPLRLNSKPSRMRIEL
ncbi:MAG: hypothetical protein LBH04_00625 [Tannerellaceae bacterium]|jgi:hypothetical protein|nr:hypothetical protein [Tannerellaceae bacterium]